MERIYDRRLLFIAFDTHTASGGIKQLYRQVDVLNKNGFRAYIVHGIYGFKCTWFDNATPILYSSRLFRELESRNPVKPRRNRLKTYRKAFIQLISFGKTLKQINNKKKELRFNKSDILVFPETYGPAIAGVLKENSKVIYNQNCYYTFLKYGFDNNSFPYTDPKVIAIIVASTDAKNYMEYVFSGSKVLRVHYGIDKNVFSFYQGKKKQIAFMPRKLREDAVQVINILKCRNVLPGWNLVPIVNMKENEVSKVLKESAIFLSFSNREGFGMPPAEAMACGCIVIGYTGKGGAEYFRQEFSYPIADRDVQSFAKTLEKVLTAFNDNDLAFFEKGKRASEFILREYSTEVEESDIVSVWNKILKFQRD